MLMIKKTPRDNGSHTNIQNGFFPLPDDFVIWPDFLDKAKYYEYNGFVNLVIVGDTVVSYEPNLEAWEAWKAVVDGDRVEQEIKAEIESLKAQLAATDYQAIKYAEGWISEEDYAPIKAERQALRDRINELEGQLSNAE